MEAKKYWFAFRCQNIGAPVQYEIFNLTCKEARARKAEFEKSYKFVFVFKQFVL